MGSKMPKAGNPVGEKIVGYLTATKRNLPWLADESGVAHRTLWGWVSQNTVPNPSRAKIAQVCKALKISIDDLFPKVETPADPLSLPLEIIDVIEVKAQQLRGAISLSLDQLTKQEKFVVPLPNGAVTISKLLSEPKEGVTVQVGRISGGSVVPLHEHPEDEWVIVLDGHCTIEVGGKSQELLKNSSVFLPAGVPHAYPSVPVDVVVVAVMMGDDNEMCGADSSPDDSGDSV
jgi:quercetin dioxygenase-like cupin family protein